MSAIRAVTFDFWGTLYLEANLPRRQVLRVQLVNQFFARLSHRIQPAQLDRGFDLLREETERQRVVHHCGLPPAAVGEIFARGCGVKLREPELVELSLTLSSAARREPPTPAPGAADVLRALYGRVKLAVISDTGMTLGRDLRAVMEADGLAGLFDCFTFSDVTGACKPTRGQFALTLDRLGVLPPEAVHVGDLEASDIAGAKGLGMRAVRVLAPSDGQTPTAADFCVHHLSELLPILRKWGVGIDD